MTTPAPVDVSLTNAEQVVLTAQAEDGKGFPVADTFTWSVDNTSVASVVPSEDTTSATLVAATPGNATVTCSDSAGLSAVVSVTVTSGPAASLSVTAGTPEAQPAPAA